MFEDYLPIFKEVYRLSKINDVELSKYLHSLDFKLVKTIQVIMYLGRDNEYKELNSSEERYTTLRKDFDKKGWDTKEVEISQMTSKGTFSDYFKAGGTVDRFV